MINLGTIKTVGKWMMIVGGSMFTCGAGLTFTCNIIERSELKKAFLEEKIEMDKKALIERIELDKDAVKAKTAADELYAAKLSAMDEVEFAKFHAERIAKANADVLARAEHMTKEADAKIVDIQIRCNDKIDSIQADCLSKIEKANKLRDEAVEKYEAIDKLFTNKKEILNAKAKLDSVLEASKKQKDDKEELLKQLTDILS